MARESWSAQFGSASIQPWSHVLTVLKNAQIVKEQVMNSMMTNFKSEEQLGRVMMLARRKECKKHKLLIPADADRSKPANRQMPEFGQEVLGLLQDAGVATAKDLEPHTDMTQRKIAHILQILEQLNHAKRLSQKRREYYPGTKKLTNGAWVYVPTKGQYDA